MPTAASLRHTRPCLALHPVCAVRCPASLQDRIANLNGRSVDLVLRQDLPGFVR